MNNLLKLLTFSLLIGFISSCGGDDKPAASDCTGVLSTGETMDLDGEEFNLSIAQLLITEGFEGDIYQFQVAGISNDCNTVKTISFISEITTDSDLNGTYDIVDFFDASLNDVYGVTLANQTLDPITQSLIEINSGTVEITKHDTREYTISINGNLVGGGTLNVDFRKVF